MSEVSEMRVRPRADAARLRIWDAPVRLFHWTLVGLIGVMWWTGEQRMLDWHRLAGYCVLALLFFRLAWGVVGSSTARFASFVRGPGTVVTYIRRDMFRRDAVPAPGHNPLGGWAVAIMILMLLAQAGLGLFAVDIDGIESGPFSYLVEFETGRRAAELHELTFNLLLGLIGLHLAAVAFYLVYRRTNLLGAMLTGARQRPGEQPLLHFRPAPLALCLLVIAGLLVWATVHFFGRT
jgi:cytochrome b